MVVLGCMQQVTIEISIVIIGGFGLVVLVCLFFCSWVVFRWFWVVVFDCLGSFWMVVFVCWWFWVVVLGGLGWLFFDLLGCFWMVVFRILGGFGWWFWVACNH